MAISGTAFHVDDAIVAGQDLETLLRKLVAQNMWPLLCFCAAILAKSSLPDVKMRMPDLGWGKDITLNFTGAAASERNEDTEYAFVLLDAEDKIIYGVLKS